MRNKAMLDMQSDVDRTKPYRCRKHSPSVDRFMELFVDSRAAIYVHFLDRLMIS